jgi:hypothetical protein
VNVFLDSSGLLAACGSGAGASRAVIDAAAGQGWSLLTSGYVLAEVESNLAALPVGASDSWAQIRPKLETVPDVLTFEWPAVFAPARDRPILFTAAAWADVLLTLDLAGNLEADAGTLKWAEKARMIAKVTGTARLLLTFPPRRALVCVASPRARCRG